MFAGLALSLLIQADAVACTVQPSMPWCAASDRKPGGSPGSVSELNQTEHDARRHYSYSEDRDGIWRSRIDDIGNNWRGNCTQLTSTELDMLYRDGWDSTKMWRVIVSTPEGRNDDPHGLVHTDELHMIGVVQANNGELWVIGDSSHTAPYLWSERGSTYKVVYSSKVSNGLNWDKSGELQ